MRVFCVYALMKPTTTTTTLSQYLIPATVILGAFLFSSKGIFTKMMYAEGLNASSILALRMSAALPFYLVGVFMIRRTLSGISIKDWLTMAGLSMIGYFLCSLINTSGLKYISVGLERIRTSTSLSSCSVQIRHALL